MAAAIVTRTLTSIVDQRLSLGNNQCGRTMVIGNNWTRLRIGVRLSLNESGFNTAFSGALFNIGLCSGTTAMVGDLSCTNFIGLQTGVGNQSGATYNRSAGPPVYYTNATGTRLISKVGSTYAYSGTANCALPYLVESTATRWATVLEFVKGSPNWSCTSIYINNSTAGDCSLTTLISAVEAGTMTTAATNLHATMYTLTAADAIAFSEVAGAIDTVNISWGISTRVLEVSDVLYARIA